MTSRFILACLITFNFANAQEPEKAPSVIECKTFSDEEKKDYWNTLTNQREDDGLPRELFLSRAKDYFKITCEQTPDEKTILQTITGYEKFLAELDLPANIDLSSIRQLIEIKSYQTVIDQVRHERDKYINPSYYLKCFLHNFTFWEDIMRFKAKSNTEELVKTLYALRQLTAEFTLRAEGLCKTQPEAQAYKSYAEALKKISTSSYVNFLKEESKTKQTPGLYFLYFTQGKVIEAKDIFRREFDRLHNKK